ncbi:MAG: carboxypeptidase regulatory-like domain-containing protein [Planctomycetes bacterium]|nr:carboxypeptidase regulatory-like domain-containing protein [Planctomycetota bacterium]
MQLALVALAIGAALVGVWRLAFAGFRLPGDSAEATTAAAPEALAEPEAPSAPVSEPVIAVELPAAPLADAESEPPAANAPDPAVDGVHGTVRDALGFPLPGARVTLRAQRGDRTAELAATSTDERGEYRIGLENWPTPLAIERRMRAVRESYAAHSDEALTIELPMGPVMLWDQRSPVRSVRRNAVEPLVLTVSASVAGYEPARERREVSGVVPGELRIDFALEPGNATFGRVDAERVPGRPFGVPGAQVLVLARSGEIEKRARAGERGEYTLYFPSVGRFDLFARHTSFGSAWLSDVSIDPFTANALPPLILRGAGRIRGSVKYPNGDAVELLAIQARHESIAARAEGGFSDAERAQLERDRGLVLADALTDSLGTFTLLGLQAGQFELRYPEESDASVQPRQRVASDDEKVELVFRGYRLRVWVRQFSSGPPDPPHIECIRLEADREGRTVERLVGAWNERGQWLVNVAAGERYLVRAWASDLQSDWTIVDIAPASYETFASLALFGGQKPDAAAVEVAPAHRAFVSTIRIDVRDGQGATVDGWVARATASDGTTPRGWLAARPSAVGEMPSLPPGTYQVSLRSESARTYAIFDCPATPLVVRAGVDATFSATAIVGGRVRIVTTKKQLDSQQQEGTFAGRARDDAWLTAFAESHAAGAPPRIPLRFMSEPADRARAPSTFLGVGSSAICDPVLAPGRYTIGLEQRGELVATTTVVVEKSSTRDATFALEPGQ